MAEHSKSIQDLIEQLDVAGGGTYKGEFDGYHVFDITDEGMDRWLKIKETGDHIYQVIYKNTGTVLDGDDLHPAFLDLGKVQNIVNY